MIHFNLALRFTVTLMILAPAASAFSYSVCNGKTERLSGTAKYYRHTPSIPSGTARASAYFNAIDRWNAVGGMADRLDAFGTTSGSTITHGDGRFDAAVVDDDDIGGNLGLTKRFYNIACIPFATRKIIEADVMVADHLTFGNPAEEVLLTNARSTFLHEFGHALGLEHNQAYNNMRVPQPRPHFGGPGEHIDVFPDDANGGRHIYPVAGTHRNVFAAAFRRDVNNTILPNTEPIVFSCTGGGGQIGILQTVGNNGNVNIQQTEQWFVDTNPTAYSSGVLFGQWNNSTYLADTVLTILRTITMPALSVGDYRIFHGVDMLNQHAEVRENDNVVLERLLVKVIQC